MKQIFTLLGLAMLTNVFAQEANVSFHSAETNPLDRKGVLRATLNFSSPGEETLFWSLYGQYEQKIPEPSQCVLIGNRSTHNSPRDRIEAILDYQSNELVVRKEYFERINSATNGRTAFRFIQSEFLTDLILRSRFFESVNLSQPVWNEHLLMDENAKMSVLASSLHLRNDDVMRLAPLLSDYEFEYSRVVGHAFVWFEQYIEDLSDLTPAQCTAMGGELLKMFENEIKLKRRFFNKAADMLGEDLAARFVAFQDYLFAMDKLNVWSKSEHAAR